MRFYWLEGKDPAKPLIEYWSCVHLQGLKGSPAIVDICRRYGSKDNPPKPNSKELKEWLDQEYLHTSFPSKSETAFDIGCRILSKQYYVNDVVASTGTAGQAINTLEQGRSNLARCNIILCKFKSNNAEVRAHFPNSEPLPPMVHLSPADAVMDLSDESPAEPAQSLGLQWDTEIDTHQVNWVHKERPFTNRGYLSIHMSPYDPGGSVSPAILDSKLIQRDICPPKDKDHFDTLELGCYDPLPECLNSREHQELCICLRRRWERMVETVASLNLIKVPLPVYPSGIPANQLRGQTWQLTDS